jgi:D-alanyl-D-alanine carboxypeptidase
VHRLQCLPAPALGIALGVALIASLAANPARAGATLVVEADTGKVLHAENATYPWYPASVTKLMTLYVTLQAIKEQRITLDSLFTVSRNAMAQAPSKMGFPAGIQVTADNAMKMMMVKSANDMAVVLAEGVAGSIENFADLMTSTAHRLGMSESNFVNPNGLPADGQITSARDLAILARALMHDFPEYDAYWHIAAIKYGRRIMRNTNSMLGRYTGIDGMKTGFICASGYNIVASATHDGRRLIAVVLGAPSSGARSIKAAELLENGFAQNPLSWLTPALGSVEALSPIDASPPNRHDEVCGPHRKRQHPADDDEDQADGSADDPNGSFSTLLSAMRAPTTKKGAALLSDLGVPVIPVVVYTGPTRGQAELARLEAEPIAVHHKKKGATASAAAKATPQDALDGKPAGRKTRAATSWTPMSSSALAASPPPELGAKAAAATPKKRHKAKQAAK